MPVFQPDNLQQTVFVEQTTNVSTTSTTFANLLTATLTTDGVSGLLVSFTAGLSITGGSNAAGEFQLLVDGTAKRGTVAGGGTGVSNAPGMTAALTYKTAVLSGGSHTITIQWKSSGVTVRIRPVTTILEHASLLVQEVLV